MDSSEKQNQVIICWLRRAAEELMQWPEEKIIPWLRSEADVLCTPGSRWWHETPGYWVGYKLMPHKCDDTKDSRAWLELHWEIRDCIDCDESGNEIDWEAYENPDLYPWESTRKRIAKAIEKANLCAKDR